MTKTIIVVDEEDNIIDHMSMNEVDKKDLRYRVAALWLKNSKGENLLARRAYNKIHNPGKWGPAAAGTVEKGETYESNIIKEIQEELGIKNLDLKPGMTFLDAGCGHSPIQYFLADLGIRVSGIDPVENAAWHGIDRRLARKFSLDIDYRVEGMEKISYPDESFDRVASVSVLEHCRAKRVEKGPGRYAVLSATSAIGRAGPHPPDSAQRLTDSH